MAQNHCRGDVAVQDSESELPVADPENGWHVCYDGQIGNLPDLMEDLALETGPYAEERLLIELYRRHGEHMLDYLGDATFAFFVTDGDNWFAARDLLGIKTLFYGRKNGTLVFASELKGVKAVTDDVHEFPPGHYTDRDGTFKRYGSLEDLNTEVVDASPARATEQIRDIIHRSFSNRVDFSVPTATLLSGGMDSSVISALAARQYRKENGDDARLKSFVVGVGESEDVLSARSLAEKLGTDHEELLVEPEEVIEALPEVIYHLESFDPSLVRSAAANFLVSREAKRQGYEVLLSGEGGDEVFCGYAYMRDVPHEQLAEKQKECLGFLHNNASLRLDRMNQCHSVRVVTPLISGELLEYAMQLPPEYKQYPDGDGKIEKWIFRKAYEEMLPEEITWRTKSEFSQGSGSAGMLPQYFEQEISDAAFEEARAAYPFLRSKEEWHYFRIFREHFGDEKAVDTVGRWPLL